MQASDLDVTHPSIAVRTEEWSAIRKFLKEHRDSEGRTIADTLPRTTARTRGRPRAVTLQWAVEAWIHYLYLRIEKDPDNARILLTKLLAHRSGDGPHSTRGSQRGLMGPPTATRKRPPGSPPGFV